MSAPELNDQRRTEPYKGHVIDVLYEGRRARPWVVFVDGSQLYGQGLRVRRVLAYETPEGALAAGRRHVRDLERPRG